MHPIHISQSNTVIENQIFTGSNYALQLHPDGRKRGTFRSYTVLVDGDDFNEPIADAVRSILDGHIVLTRDLGWKPEADADRLADQRAKMSGTPEGIADGGTYDVVVVGGGAGGVPAAIAAARGGAKVAIVQDRPVYVS